MAWMNNMYPAGNFPGARKIQRIIKDISISSCSLNGSMYSVIKEDFKLRGLNIGSVREPLESVSVGDLEKIEVIKGMIDKTNLKI
ncbi:hypothetical protein [Sporosarcina sp. FSL K6-1508]|uniref:hypothetical protein n=1 Tax=Sporosarcina sp. FSL K6-1508 TaxID=2921553 RepID=UPI0030F4FC8E